MTPRPSEQARGPYRDRSAARAVGNTPLRSLQRLPLAAQAVLRTRRIALGVGAARVKRPSNI